MKHKFITWIGSKKVVLELTEIEIENIENFFNLPLDMIPSWEILENLEGI